MKTETPAFSNQLLERITVKVQNRLIVSANGKPVFSMDRADARELAKLLRSYAKNGRV